MEEKVIESVLEGILFAAGEPVDRERLAAVMGEDPMTVDEAATRLADQYRYEQRGIRILRLENAYQMTTAPDYADLIRRALETRKPPRLSPALLEVLTVIAYFQPTTRGYVEQVRGVDSSHSFRALLDQGPIEEAGKLSVPGRPTLFRTTPLFLKTFGLTTLEELPPLPTEGEESQLSLRLSAQSSDESGETVSGGEEG